MKYRTLFLWEVTQKCHKVHSSSAAFLRDERFLTGVSV